MRTKVEEILNDVRHRMLSKRSADGMWRGSLSSSAISTSVSVFALHRIDSTRFSSQIQDGTAWLLTTMKTDGSWGDSIESPSNMTATLLSYVSLHALGKAPLASHQYLSDKFEGDTEEHIIEGVLSYYGKDLTFSVPILMMCAMAGVISNWDRIPPFPFELAIFPQRFFRYLNLPVVSYAIPALIAVGILQHRKRKTWWRWLREPFVGKTMKRLVHLQPEDGGFLEAAPLTAFVSMCLAEAGFKRHEVTQKCAMFLSETQREDGAWPIDTDLAGWVTSLCARALGDELDDASLAQQICDNATKSVHYFTGAPAGGWGWTNLSGSVPDGDDTSGALVALHALTNGSYSQEVKGGLNWLMKLQNNDGGMPTFCKGWGKLPFDRSSPDITAHAVLAFGLWIPCMPEADRLPYQKCMDRMLGWLECNSKGGCWVPLWFGDQDAEDEKNPVYGTATLMDYLLSTDSHRAHMLAQKGADFLLRAQNADGGWGGNAGVASKVTLTAKALSALAALDDEKVCPAIERGVNYLYRRYENHTLYEREPIGLYFARLWYSEEMYNLTYLMSALKRLKDVF